MCLLRPYLWGKSDNLEAAISCFNAALKVRTIKNFPLDWAETQNNLGTAYDERILGKRANNLELAIRCYKDVLKIYTRSDLPFDWAKNST